MKPFSVRPGFALPAAIIALVLLSALVAGVLFVSTEELRAGQTDTADQRALAAAEWAVERAILTWNSERNNAQRIGTAAVLDAGTSAPNDSVALVATRVGRNAVWITAQATSRGDGRTIPARHTVAASLRLRAPNVPIRAALTTGGPVEVSGGVIDGGDAAASGGSSVCTDSRPGAGISTATPSQVTCVTCAGGSPPGVFGSPRIDSITVDSTFSGMLNAVFDTLASRAIVSLPAGTYAPAPSTANDECNRADPLNWGDPTGTGVCTNWFPIVRIAGDAVLAAGARGQGVLLVSGRLRVEANALFAGIVVAAGVDVDGSGAEISGAVFAGTAASSVTNGGAIRLVTCVARRASLGVARLEHTPGRWWVELR